MPQVVPVYNRAQLELAFAEDGAMTGRIVDAKKRGCGAELDDVGPSLSLHGRQMRAAPQDE